MPAPLAVDTRRPGERIAYRPAAIRRISWGAVLAGVVIALVAQPVLHLLRMGIGPRLGDSLLGDIPQGTLSGTTTGLWWMAFWGLGLLLGGWVAGRLAGMPRRLDAALHGVLTWALTVLTLFYLLTTVLGNLMRDEFNTLSAPIITSGRGTTTSSSALELPWETVRQEIETTLQHTGQAPFHPDPLGETARRPVELARVTNQDLLGMIERLVRHDTGAMSTPDPEVIISAMMARTVMSREQAVWTLQRWQQDYQRARAEAPQTTQPAEETSASIASQASLWMGLALVLGAIAAALGGALGAPRDLSAAVVRET